MKALKIGAILLVVYVGIVITFESLIGYFQPGGQSTLVITTTDEDGVDHDRVLARVETDGKLYAAANHWPRSWFTQAIENPKVSITYDGDKIDYLAVPVSEEEHLRVDGEHSLGFVVRFLTGFPPRLFVRLDPR